MNIKELEIQFNLDNIDLLSSIICELFGDFTIVGLIGELGSGKTTFIKSLCKNYGLYDQVSSPTYSIENEYNVTNQNLIIRHIDLYRGVTLELEEELIERRYPNKKEIVLIEWYNLANSQHIYPFLSIYFNFTKSGLETERIVKIIGEAHLLGILSEKFKKKP